MTSYKPFAQRCMVVMNSILLVLSLILFGTMWYVNSSSDPAFKAIAGYSTFMGVVAVIIAVFAILGFCASCGGCFLFFYSVALNILSFICIVITVVGFVLYHFSTKVFVMQ